MGLLILLTILFFPFVKLKAQVVTDPGLTKVAIFGNKINAAIQAINKTTAEGVTTLTQLNDNIKQSSRGLLDLTQQYQKALSSVNSYIASSSRVKEVFTVQAQMVRLYAGVHQYDDQLSSDEQDMVHTAMKNSLKKSGDILSDLKMLVRPDFYKMTDHERITEIDHIYEKMYFQYTGMNHFMDKISAYCAHKNIDLKAQADAHAIFGSNP